MKTAVLLGSFLFAASTFACASSESAQSSDADLTASALPVTKTFSNIAMHLPANWDIDAYGNTAYVGILAGGPSDVALRVELHNDAPIDKLAPTECPQEGNPPIAVKSVVTVDSGFKPLGDKTADYRRFKVTCVDGTVSEHQAWRLPVSKIAVYEQHGDASTANIVAKMLVTPLEDIAFENITFHVGTGWDIYRTGNTAAFGVLAGGPNDVALALTSKFTGGIDSLEPKTCHVEGGPDIPAKKVFVIDSGLAQMGADTKADYRQWSVNCVGDEFETHRAWVLPVSKIAIFENHETDTTEELILNATVAH